MATKLLQHIRFGMVFREFPHPLRIPYRTRSRSLSHFTSTINKKGVNRAGPSVFFEELSHHYSWSSKVTKNKDIVAKLAEPSFFSALTQCKKRKCFWFTFTTSVEIPICVLHSTSGVMKSRQSYFY